jgi:alkyl hydroperoxide reductase subunit AhpC
LFSENAWKAINEKVGTPSLYIFTDNPHQQNSLADKLGLELSTERLTRVLCIVDDKDTIQFISEDDLDIVSSVSRMLSGLKQISGQI